VPCSSSATHPYERNAEQSGCASAPALGEMAAGLAHEIRNPLAGMEILTGSLRRRLQQQPEELALVNELTAEIRRVAQTVTDSLEFVALDGLRRDPVDPSSCSRSRSLARARVFPSTSTSSATTPRRCCRCVPTASASRVCSPI
jgi:signal transduction histidine kinase